MLHKIAHVKTRLIISLDFWWEEFSDVFYPAGIPKVAAPGYFSDANWRGYGYTAGPVLSYNNYMGVNSLIELQLDGKNEFIEM